MDEQRIKQIREIFDHLVDKSPSHRADYLDIVCEGDDALRHEIELMLAAQEQSPDAPTLVHPDTSSGAPPSQKVQSIGGYQLLEEIAAGGMGVVYRAEHPEHGVVAVKLLPKYTVVDGEAAQRFHREADVLSSLQHPALVRLFECFVDQAYAVLVMELIDGVELTEHIKHGPLSLEFTMGVMAALSDALSLAHARGITHRDLKPGNVLLTNAGQTKLIDFGIAKFADQKLTATGQIMGTPNYMSPEQWLGKQVGTYTDVWALGTIWYEMLTGHRVFSGRDLESAADAVLSQSIPRLPRKSADGRPLGHVQQVLDDMLCRDSAARIENAMVLRQRLSAA